MKYVTITLSLLLLIGLAVQPVLSQDLKKGIVAYWDFNKDGGETTSDSSGNGHDGTLLGDTKWTKDGYFGGGVVFDGAGDEVNIPYHKDLNPEVFTITAWANVADGGAGHRAVVSSRADFPQRGFIFYCTPANTWQFWIGAGANHWKSAQGPAVNLDKWDHLAGTYADGNHRFYVNGEFAAEQNFDIDLNPDQEFLIGAGANETANHNYFFNGTIDEVRLYNRVLDDNEIEAVMKSESLDVEPSGKIALTWGQLKTK